MYTLPGVDYYPAGTYYINVFNWNGQYSGFCSDLDTVVINQPAQLVASVSGNNVACFGGTTTLNASAVGGTPAYMFSLNGGAYQASGSFTGITASSNPYVMTVRDANMCTATVARTVTQAQVPCKNAQESAASEIETPNEIRVYPNPSTGVFNIVLPSGDNKVKLVATDISGKVIATQSFEENHATLIRLELYNVAKGVYLLQVNDGDDIYRSKLIVE